ncbi:MAG TPA: glycoside hydrolase family 3 N-terminal domain-containing protein [Chloroflexota bacterium]|jgi:beta-N-acetylhexosaminidase|nr:glycoside hydrolase family 3 N-terminal domain-containing protein [Chloroflexota bacterium]
MSIPLAIETLSLEEKVGQLFLLAFEGETVADAEILLGRYLVGGVYLSQDNLTGIDQAVALLSALQDLGASTPHGLPIFAACDQEGAWTVLNPQTSSGPGNLALGATQAAQVEKMYAVIGRELHALGISAALAPVADVNTNPRNPIIGTRSFGEDPERVALAVAAAVRGLHRGGVRSCLKHFPGHGDTAQDTHRGLATVVRDRRQLDAGDLVPFRTGIAAGADIVMTAHLFYPALDAEWPATLSPAILTGLLREELGFDGVILTDSFNMGSIRRAYAPSEAVVRAINAGADMVLLAEERYGDEPVDYLAHQVALIEAVRAAAHAGAIPEARLNQAVGRVLRLKAAASLFGAPHPNPGEAHRIVGSAPHRATALESARAAVTLVRNLDGQVPLRLAAAAPLALVSAVDPAAHAALRRMRGIGPNVSEPPTAVLWREIARRHPTTEQLTLLDADAVAAHLPALSAAAAVVVATENYPLPGFDFPTAGQRAVLEALLATGIAPIVIGLRDPYELADLPGIRTYLSALGYASVCAQAAAEVLFGERAAVGRLPVSV